MQKINQFIGRQLSRNEMKCLKGGLQLGGVDCSVNCGSFVMKVTCTKGYTCSKVDGEYARCTKGNTSTQVNCPSSSV
jgi:hypothetical protein